jgi:ATP-binding cassette subfamily F protein uup
MLVSIDRISCAFAKGELFTELSFVIQAGERLALIGPNGSGKSTLLKFIAGLASPDEGEIIRRRGLTSAVVAQEDSFPAGGTVKEILEASIPNLSAEEQRRRVAQWIGTAGFGSPSQRVEELSGGWRKRLSIVRAMIQEPELLMLDEPTNHLDLDGILWLEELINRFRGTTVFVSHDRYFIERTSTRVIEINRQFPKGFVSVPGKYSDFLEGRELFVANLKSQRDSLANKVRREVEWLRQGAKARTTKSQSRIQRAGEMIDQLASFKFDDRKVEAEFSESGRRTKELVVAEDVYVQFGDRRIFSDLSVVISPGSRVGIVGPNGSGKTTLLKTMIGELKPSGGRLKTASNLRAAVFDQLRKRLNPEVTLHRALAPEGDYVIFNGKPVHVSGWASRFLLRPQQLTTKVANLSGGEQARVLVASMMIQPCDILVLDEPTNDLDIQTLEALEESLGEFQGGVIVVSHDRYLLERVCSTVLGIGPDGRITTYASYLQWEADRELQSERQKEKPKKGEAAAEEGDKTDGAIARGRLSYKDKRDWETIQQRIESAEARVASISKELEHPENHSDGDKLMELTEQLSNAQEEVETLYARWGELEELVRKIEGLGSGETA